MPIHLSLQQEINAPPERVFATLTDLDAASKWMTNFVGIEKLTPDKVGVGMKWRETRKMYGQKASELFEVTGYEPNKTVELYVDGTQGSSRRGYYRFRYQLEPRDGKTALTMTGEIGGLSKVMEFFGRLMVGSFKKAMTKDLEAMTRYIEGTRAS
ncbi:SRPBCC family protein [Hyalangium rubrum]|uniref:SRPBCC family protein n=1 Tax=Hyalangium rubrum TaxID=3103134 RepID=A0ABU5HCF1_9BACT|nr:SRPBCC family protein [Hyalangium sp. s54d21]MDY7231138.1 SRPBCC family protein [Hyalangium sp. s54d21]